MKETKTEEKTTETVSKLRFRTMYTNTEKLKANPAGDKTRPKYHTYLPYEQDPDTGEIMNRTPYPKRVKVGEVDIQAEIQSYKDGTELKSLLASLARQGVALPTVSVSDHVDDYTDIPQTLGDLKEAQNVLKEVQRVQKEQAATIKKQQEIQKATQEAQTKQPTLTQDQINQLLSLLNNNNSEVK